MFGVAQVWSVASAYRVFGTYPLFLAFFPFYIPLFIAGTLAYRNQWLAQMPGKMLRFWGWLSAALILALPALMIGGGAVETGLDPFLKGLTWQCAALSLWFGFACIAFSTTLTLWIRERTLPHSKLAALAGPNTFTVYLIHPVVLVPITYALVVSPLTPAVKFGLASLLTVAICYAAAALLRRLPGAKAIL
jgi:fucose 4-O-acetylase-like acetyltransferase